MKSDAKQQYIAALVEHARRKTIGTTNPVVVQAYQFFDQACGHAEIPHPFNPGNTKQILDQFTDSFSESCFSGDGELHPIHVMKVAKDVGRLCGYGRQAVIDADRTPAAYREAATIGSTNGITCWALFGPHADRQHPIVSAGFATEKKRIQTTVVRFNEKTAFCEDDSVKLELSGRLNLPVS